MIIHGVSFDSEVLYKKGRDQMLLRFVKLKGSVQLKLDELLRKSMIKFVGHMPMDI